MNIQEIDEFKKYPDINHARKAGKAIFKAEYDLFAKRAAFAELFNEVIDYSEQDSIFNMWAVGCMLEDNVATIRKIDAVRGFLRDENLTAEYIEEWAWAVFKAFRASEELLEFIAVDIRNVKGISPELRQFLRHPSPQQQYA